ncbi:ABC transporter permease [Paenarthrobacter sp. YJN-D]|uniref:ABC transporter permease n=1 Tax=Paenarthrobacter sp. YJN-D TaxID=2735317 RepID=UPI0018786763|nr:ABC transporter permease subunit [Paenarthrobacter sp. YJN-D]QOT23134.1 ABC transporter permease subunit [Paenarthrobacter sp. YJN-D]
MTTAVKSRAPRTHGPGITGERIFLRLVVPAVLVGIWWALSAGPGTGLFIASPWAALVRAGEEFLSPDISSLFLGEATFQHLIPSLARAMAGLALATAAGVAAGIALGSVPVLASLFQPLIHLGRSLPSPALLGVFFLLFGTGDSPKIFLIAFGVVWPILFNTIDGVNSIGHQRLQAAAVFKIRPLDVLFNVILPGASPKIFAGVRTSLSLSLIIMIISELQKSKNGLGYLLVTTQRTFDYTNFWAILIVLGLLGVALNVLFHIVERRALSWHRGATQQHD